MALNKVTYVDGQTVIHAANLNDIQDEIIAQETGKQDLLTAGTGITISNENVISATGGEWGSITGNLEDQTDLNEVLTEHSSQISTLNEIVNLEYVPIPYDESAFTLGKRVNYNTGTLANSSTGLYDATDYIDISSADTIYYSRDVTTTDDPKNGVAFYDADKVYISGQQAIENAAQYSYELTKLDVPQNAVYARFTVFDNTETYGEFQLYSVPILKDKIDDLETSVSGKQNIPTTDTITIASASWSNNSVTVTVSGVTSSNLVELTPSTKADSDAWGANGLFCSAQGTDSLTFTCVSTPTDSISLGVVIW